MVPEVGVNMLDVASLRPGMAVYDTSGHEIGSIGQLAGCGFELVACQRDGWVPYDWVATVFSHIVVTRFEGSELASLRLGRAGQADTNDAALLAGAKTACSLDPGWTGLNRVFGTPTAENGAPFLPGQTQPRTATAERSGCQRFPSWVLPWRRYRPQLRPLFHRS